MTIQTMPKDHQGLGLPFEVKVLAFMGDSLSISNALTQHSRSITAALKKPISLPIFRAHDHHDPWSQ
jgi:hypothetical protein